MHPTTVRRPYENPEIDRIFGVFLEKQTYRNLAYLLLSFPLGLVYFLVLVPTLAISVSLMFVFAGFPLLLGVLLFAEQLLGFERFLIRSMLRGDILARRPTVPENRRLFARLGQRLAQGRTWRGLFYLLLRFAMGLASFVLVIVLIPVSLGLVLAPLLAALGVPIEITGIPTEILDQSLLCCSAGAVLALISAHILNGWTGLWKRIAISLVS